MLGGSKSQNMGLMSIKENRNRSVSKEFYCKFELSIYDI